MAAVVACGGAGSGGPLTPQDVTFTDHGSSQYTRRDGGPQIVVSADAAGTGLGELAAGAPAGRLYIGVFMGERRTGGYGVKVDRVERDADRLVVRATFVSPPKDALTIQVITSPAQLVSIDRQSAAGAKEAVLLDQSGAEMARTAVPQSRT